MKYLLMTLTMIVLTADAAMAQYKTKADCDQVHALMVIAQSNANTAMNQAYTARDAANAARDAVPSLTPKLGWGANLIQQWDALIEFADQAQLVGENGESNGDACMQVAENEEITGDDWYNFPNWDDCYLYYNRAYQDFGQARTQYNNSKAGYTSAKTDWDAVTAFYGSH